MQRWPEAGALHGDFETDDLFKDMQYVHTNVSHKKKVGVPQQFVAIRHVTFPDGSKKSLLGGTQTIDGYWPELRRAVGRTGHNTGDHPGTDARKKLT